MADADSTSSGGAPHGSAPRPSRIQRGPGEPTDTEKLELVAQLLDILPDFFYVHDDEMVFRYANMKAVKYFGCNTREELIGRRLHEVDPNPEQGKKILDFLLSDDGQRHWASAFLRPVFASALTPEMKSRFLPDADYARAKPLDVFKLSAASKTIGERYQKEVG